MATTNKEKAVEDQLIEAAVDSIKDRGGFSVFNPGGEVADFLEGGKMAQMSTAEDKITIYDTSTGEPRNILVNMLAKTLKKRRGGKPAFSMKEEEAPVYARGNIICYLSPNHPDRDYYRSLGINQECTTLMKDDTPVHADHLASEMDREIHMSHKHPRAWAIIQGAIAKAERDEELALRREGMAAIRALATSRGDK